MLGRFRRLVSLTVKGENYTAEGLKEDYKRAATFREIYFTLIEGVVIIGALQVAAEKSGSYLLSGLWMIGNALIAYYIQTGVVYLMRLAVEEATPARARNAALWLTGGVALVLSGASIWFVSTVVAAVIRNSIMI